MIVYIAFQASSARKDSTWLCLISVWDVRVGGSLARFDESIKTPGSVVPSSPLNVRLSTLLNTTATILTATSIVPLLFVNSCTSSTTIAVLGEIRRCEALLLGFLFHRLTVAVCLFVLILCMMTARQTAKPAPVGSHNWVANERALIRQHEEQDIEDFAFSARNDLEWLNEHMVDIFERNQVWVYRIFFVPTKNRPIC